MTDVTAEANTGDTTLRPPFSTGICKASGNGSAAGGDSAEGSRTNLTAVAKNKPPGTSETDKSLLSTPQEPTTSSNIPMEKYPKDLSGPVKQIYVSLLPILFANNKHKLQRASKHIGAFLDEDLDVARLNKIHGWLWLAGRPQAARPVHRQLMMNRTIIVTEQADLHLTWNDSSIYIKPLPKYLLCKEFWEEYLCKEASLHAKACGFLRSYAWLICYESDFLLASKGNNVPYLLPLEVTWTNWQVFVEELLDNVDLEGTKDTNSLYTINPRYKYGELRLGRLNKIYRYAPLWYYKHIFRGYHYGYHQYSDFFSRNFAWLIVVFAYITVVLTAMQVGLALDGFKDNPILTSTSYGFSVFSMVLIAAVVGIALLLFIILFIYNLLATAYVQIQRAWEGGKKKKDGKVKAKNVKIEKAKAEKSKGKGKNVSRAKADQSVTGNQDEEANVGVAAETDNLHKTR